MFESADDTISNILWKLKGVAIISVICAHCNIQVDAEGIYFLRNILNNLGTLGVGMFFFVSGYYYRTNESSVLKFFAAKIDKLIIPWVVAATCVWIYITVRKGGFGLKSWIYYVIGNGSIYYFMFDLLAIQILFLILNKMERINKETLCVIMIGLSELFVVLESNGKSFFPTSYMNFGCFIGYFSFGILCSRRCLLDRIMIKCSEKKWLVRICTLLCIITIIQPVYVMSYFAGITSLPLELVYILTAVIALSSVKGKGLEYLGHKSFFIYLWHLPVAGIVSNIGSRNIFIAYSALLWPAIIITIMSLLIKLIEKVKSNEIKSWLGLH